jgi:hypothetical protein
MSHVRLGRHAGAGEAIHVWQADRSLAPQEFIWRGRRYLVRSVESDGYARTATKDSAHRYRIRTTSGLRCILRHDAALGSWRMDRVVSGGGGT